MFFVNLSFRRLVFKLNKLRIKKTQFNVELNFELSDHLRKCLKFDSNLKVVGFGPQSLACSQSIHGMFLKLFITSL